MYEGKPLAEPDVAYSKPVANLYLQYASSRERAQGVCHRIGVAWKDWICFLSVPEICGL